MPLSIPKSNYSNLRNSRCEQVFFFQMQRVLMDFDDFEPSRVFVEYLDQFPPDTSKNRAVGIVLKIRIDWYGNCYKKLVYV